ncbi:hypothetical protein M011DRAFT_121847 [Sporormia fimetaria CBS 119925]|uniref:BHLH domain-containing protein n=1 Tax=Sporormia fimetaria CBS 119925 TaxID=1340428 RepID=A0A6A6V7W2_9PLEO|nr:hypothetical protein M011DRAFT_121847 [Sporormia fimetaria CBS 119925]
MNYSSNPDDPLSMAGFSSVYDSYLSYDDNEGVLDPNIYPSQLSYRPESAYIQPTLAQQTLCRPESEDSAYPTETALWGYTSPPYTNEPLNSRVSSLEPASPPFSAYINPSATLISSPLGRPLSPTPSVCGDQATEPIKSETWSPQPLTSPSNPTYSNTTAYGVSPCVRQSRAAQAQRPRPKSLPVLFTPLTNTTSHPHPHNHTHSHHLPYSPSSPRKLPIHRTTHKDIERKYREGINSDLERLRRAIPSLAQSDEDESGGDEGGAAKKPVKPTKSQVLAAALEYIKHGDEEREALREEVRALREEKERGWEKG